MTAQQSTKSGEPKDLAELIKKRNERRAKGSEDFRYTISGEPSSFTSEKINFAWRDISATVHPAGARWRLRELITCRKNPPKQILNNVNGQAKAGEFLALMGPSGAGKTTLLNILTANATKDITVTGTILCNDEPIFLPTFPNIMAYVHQEDIFLGNLTVREQLMFRANVSMDRSLSAEDKRLLIDRVVVELGLSSCQNTVIGIPGKIKGISGGEKKRLALAGEFLNNPSLIFCDEPTSGLDSFMASNVVHVLKKLTKKGKTVICTIHQPSSEIYAEFDQIYLMCQGRVAFLGSTANAVKFFSNLIGPCPQHYNPADYFILGLAIDPTNVAECKENVTAICDKYDEMMKPAKQAEMPPTSTVLRKFEPSHVPSRCNIILAVLKRAWVNFIRDPDLIRVKILQTSIMAVVVGSVYYQTEVKDSRDVSNLNSAILIVLLNMTFLCMLSVINVFCEEIPVFLRERKKKLYGINTYFLSRIIVELPIYVLNPFLFAAVTYKMIDLNPDPIRFLLACFIHVLSANVASGFGYFISAITSDINLALAIGPPVLTPFILFSGFFINLNTIPAYYRWLTYVSWFRHSMEALMILQWQDFVADDWHDTPGGPSHSFPIGNQVLQDSGFHPDHFHRCVYCLVFLNLLYRLLAYLALYWRTFTI